MAEFLGGLGLIIGFLTRIAAFGVFVNMIVAILMVHSPNGFFMNWSGAQKGEGIEYHLLVLAITVVLMLRGAGAWSVDRILTQRQAGPIGDAKFVQELPAVWMGQIAAARSQCRRHQFRGFAMPAL